MNMSTTGKVGLFTMVVLVMLALMISWKSNIFLIRDGVEITGSFKNIEGLTVGSEVRYRGFNVGKVMRVDPGPSDIKLYAIVKKGIQIPSDSRLRVGFDGIVGSKYLEIRPGTSEVMCKDGSVLAGVSTAGIVDFVDIAAQNLVETKKILLTLRSIIEDPALQAAFKDAVFTADKLVEELRVTNAGIMKVTNDPKFQDSVKGTVAETHKTLTSANQFFESFGKLNVNPSADIQYGTVSNTIRANLDIVQSPADYLRIGIGEGPTQNISLLDIEISKKVLTNFAMRLGMINTHLGGGIDFFASKYMELSGDIYDFNNPKPRDPKFRATAKYSVNSYGDILLQGDDIFNPERNYSIGVRIKSGGGFDE